MHAFVRWHALVATAFLALRARGLGITDAADARAAAWAFVIGAALTIRSAVVREGAAIFACRAAGDAGACYALAADGGAVRIATTLEIGAGAIDTYGASGAFGIGATNAAVVVRGARIAALLISCTGCEAFAIPTSVADRNATLIIVNWFAVVSRAALRRAVVVALRTTANSIRI